MALFFYFGALTLLFGFLGLVGYTLLVRAWRSIFWKKGPSHRLSDQ